MSTLIDRYCKALEWLIALLLAVMVLLVFGNVVLRYVANSGITCPRNCRAGCSCG
jgi:TRAP-type transport system small permease protein